MRWYVRPIVRDHSGGRGGHLGAGREQDDTSREEIARRTDTSRARSSYPQHPAVRRRSRGMKPSTREIPPPSPPPPNFLLAAAARPTNHHPIRLLSSTTSTSSSSSHPSRRLFSPRSTSAASVSCRIRAIVRREFDFHPSSLYQARREPCECSTVVLRFRAKCVAFQRREGAVGGTRSLPKEVTGYSRLRRTGLAPSFVRMIFMWKRSIRTLIGKNS